jgi:hypothetical protein
VERGEPKVDQLVHLFFFQQVIGVDGRGNDRRNYRGRRLFPAADSCTINLELDGGMQVGAEVFDIAGIAAVPEFGEIGLETCRRIVAVTRIKFYGESTRPY